MGSGVTHRRFVAWNYLTISNFVDLLARKNGQINDLKLDHLNHNKALAVRARHLTGFKRLLFAVSKGDVPRLHSLVDTMLRDGASIFTILDKVDLACRQVYSPKNYAEVDYQRLYLFHKLGGRAVAELAHRTLGLPSIETTRQHIRTQPLLVSSKMPTAAEMRHNLEINFPPQSEDAALSTADKPVVGFQLMADEIKIESRLRWDAKSNIIHGTCREHNDSYGLEFKSMKQPEDILRGLNEKDEKKRHVHFATEATVLAVSHFSDEPRAYSAHPFVVSGSCKQEKTPAQQTMLETAREVLVDKSKDIMVGGCRGRLYNITSDGDARRRRATCFITMTHTLDPTSPIFENLGYLRLFDLLCGEDDITGDIEYKHLIKRLRNSLLRAKGVTINGQHLNQSILRKHLRHAGLEEHRVTALCSPHDKQDVKLAYDLLSALAVLPHAKPSDPPPFHAARNALRLLGSLYAHLLEAYTNTQLSLHEQLVHLSAAAHIIIAIYSHDRGNSMPSQTYFDWMLAIKNAYFCVAKAQFDNPDGKFWIILIGTDPLESLFGHVRTIQGNDCNVDVLQLGNRVESAAMCTRIIAEHPTWQRSLRRSTFKTWRDEAGDISAKIDHINPASWEGDVRVKNVVLLTCWEEG
ncbi:hypothetical protein FIBSPDRAFT_722568, partial [Athelia psychrophila]